MSRAATLTVDARNRFDQHVEQARGDLLRASDHIQTIQVNIGLTCNLACRHCHVESSPKRDEQMDWPTCKQVLSAACRARASTIDITGGAPEMNPHFRRFVSEAGALGFAVIVRTNLTILLQDGYTDLPEFFRDHRVHLVASLPCYLPENVDRQRGLKVYQQSIDAIQRLNAVGYGIWPHLPLDLVYNPLGPTLPPETEALEAEYRQVLREQFNIQFTGLITITNMAIGRFRHDLARDGRAESYESLLRETFNPATIEPLMCRHQLHVSHDGRLHDCDFNYALGLGCNRELPDHIQDFDPARFAGRRISTGEHCFGCTAGAGSSCGGALVQDH